MIQRNLSTTSNRLYMEFKFPYIQCNSGKYGGRGQVDNMTFDLSYKVFHIAVSAQNCYIAGYNTKDSSPSEIFTTVTKLNHNTYHISQATKRHEHTTNFN